MSKAIKTVSRICLILFTAAGLSSGTAVAQEGAIKSQPVSDNIHMLTGPGGNLAVLVGERGAFVVDDKYAEQTEAILEVIASLSDQPVQFVINTHWHGDHTGGNQNMTRAGAVIVAHQNVRTRMGSEQFLAAFDRTVPASPDDALPAVTFADQVTFHWNGEEVHVFHVANAHTDGDAIVQFKTSNVIHMGDTYFNGRYPFIDLSSGGSIDGVIATADRVLELADDETQIVPGHGALSDRSALENYRNVLNQIRGNVSNMISEGKSLDEVLAAKPSEEWDADWGQAFVKPDRFISIVYASLAGQ